MSYQSGCKDGLKEFQKLIGCGRQGGNPRRPFFWRSKKARLQPDLSFEKAEFEKNLLCRGYQPRIEPALVSGRSILVDHALADGLIDFRNCGRKLRLGVAGLKGGTELSQGSAQA